MGDEGSPGNVLMCSVIQKEAKVGRPRRRWIENMKRDIRDLILEGKVLQIGLDVEEELSRLWTLQPWGQECH